MFCACPTRLLNDTPPARDGSAALVYGTAWGAAGGAYIGGGGVCTTGAAGAGAGGGVGVRSALMFAAGMS